MKLYYGVEMTSREQSAWTRSAPYYAFAERYDRELFLSSLGAFTTEERELFHRICAVWEPEIPYRRVLAAAGEESGAGNRELNRLIRKLRRHQCAVLTTRCVEGETCSYGVVLCEPAAPVFFVTALEEHLRRVEYDSALSLPVDSDLGIDAAPAAIRRQLDTGVLTTALIGGCEGEPGVYALPLRERGEHLLLPSAALGTARKYAELVLRRCLEQPELLSWLSQIRSMGLLELKQQIADADVLTWKSVSTDVIDHIRELASGDAPHHFSMLEPAAALMCISAEAELEAAAMERHRADRRQRAISHLVAQIRESSVPFLTQTWLNEQFALLEHQHPEEFESIKSEFYREYAGPVGNTRLSQIMRIQGRYIHRDRIVAEFERRLEAARTELRTAYHRALAEEIRSPDRSRNPAFFGPENLDRDIAQRLRREDPFVAILLADPPLLTEVIIHEAKQRRSENGPTQLQRLIDRLFMQGNMSLRSHREILGISVEEILQEYIDGLGILRQLWLRLSGRHAHLQERYLTPRTSRLVTDQTTGRRPAARAENALRESGNSAPGKLRQRAASVAPGAGGRPHSGVPAASSESPTTSKTDNVVRRPYSHKEREDAWAAFSRTLGGE